MALGTMSWLLVALAAAVAAAGSVQAATGESSLGCIETYDPNANYFASGRLTTTNTSDVTQGSDYVEVKVAEDFTVRYYKSYKIVRNRNSGELLVLYQCGTPKPNVIAFNTSQIFEIPIKTVATTETVSLAFFQILGLQSHLRFIDGTYASTPCVQSMFQNGQVKQVSPVVPNGTNLDGSYYGWQDPNAHKQQMAEVDVLLVDAYTSSRLLTAYNSTTPDHDPKNVAFDTTSDTTLLGRAEWAKFLSLFFNAEKAANDYFDKTVARYNCYSAEAKAQTTMPKVAFLSAYYGSGPFTVDATAYKLDLITAAGGVNVADRILTGSYSTIGYLEAALKDVDIIVDQSYAVDPSTYTLNSFLAVFNFSSNAKFISNGQVLRFDGLMNNNSGLDWFEGAIAQPDVVLRDFMSFLHPQLAASGPKNKWFRNIAGASNVAPTVLTGASCPGDNLAAVPSPTFACDALFAPTTAPAPAPLPNLVPETAPAPSPAGNGASFARGGYGCSSALLLAAGFGLLVMFV